MPEARTWRPARRGTFGWLHPWEMKRFAARFHGIFPGFGRESPPELRFTRAEFPRCLGQHPWMRDVLQEIVTLQKVYSAKNTQAMQRRGVLIRHSLRDEFRRLGPPLRAAMGPYGDDADAKGRDNTGQMSRIPWARWFSKSRSPSATNGWYVVYLFHPDGSGVSLYLSHGSTRIDGKAFINRSEAEAAELMDWASDIIQGDFAGDGAVRTGVVLGTFDLAVGYQRTTVFSKFYPDSDIPAEADLEADLLRFVRALAKLYRAQQRGQQPTPASPDLLDLSDAVEDFTAPLKSGGKGQGRGLSGSIRKLVEEAAMQRARKWLEEKSFEYNDVSASDCCDFRARRSGEEWVIEVKGTTGAAGSVLLTRNEVKLHRKSHPCNALLVVHGISVSADGTQATGGQLIAFYPWKLEEERLSSICYEYRLG